MIKEKKLYHKKWQKSENSKVERMNCICPKMSVHIQKPKKKE